MTQTTVRQKNPKKALSYTPNRCTPAISDMPGNNFETAMSTSTNKDTIDMDSIIGRRIRQCRQAHKMSQTKLANQVGIAWQQIQKYEGGKNRVSATMLWKIADVFDVPLSFFFEEIAEELGVETDNGKFANLRGERLLELYAQLGAEQKSAVFSYVKSVSRPELAREAAE